MNPLYVAFPVFWVLIAVVAFVVIKHDRKVLAEQKRTHAH